MFGPRGMSLPGWRAGLAHRARCGENLHQGLNTPQELTKTCAFVSIWARGRAARVRLEFVRGACGSRARVGPQLEAVFIHVEAPTHLELQRVETLLRSTKAPYKFPTAVGIVETNIEARCPTAERRERVGLDLRAARTALERPEN